MKAIWKFPIQITGRQSIAMPKGAEILCVDTQRDIICLWAIVDTEAALEAREIAVVGTGHEMAGDTYKYIGTAQTSGGELVWHVFEVIG